MAKERRPCSTLRGDEFTCSQDVLKELVSLYTCLTDLAVQGASLDVITVALADRLGSPVAVVSPELNILASATVPKMDVDLSHIVTSHQQLPQALSAAAQTRHALRIAGDEGLPSCVAAPVLVGDEVLAYVLVIEGDQYSMTNSELNVLVARHAGTVYGIAMTREKIATELASTMKSDLLINLLHGHITNREEVRRWANRIGYDCSCSYRVLVLAPNRLEAITGEPHANSPGVISLRRRVFTFLTQALRERCRQIITGFDQHELVALVPDVPSRRPVDSLPPVDLGQSAIRYVARYFPQVVLTVGIGGICQDPYELPESYAQAQQALRLARRLARDGQVVNFEDLGVYRLLLQLSESALREFVNRVLGQLIAYDRKNGGGLIRTLASYFRHDGSHARVAAELYVHLNTVGYRLNRIAEITGLDFGRYEDRLLAHLAVVALELLPREDL